MGEMGSNSELTIFEIEHLLWLDTDWNSREESNQSLGKDLLAEKTAGRLKMTWLSELYTISTALVKFQLAAVLHYEKQQNNSRRTKTQTNLENVVLRDL